MDFSCENCAFCNSNNPPYYCDFTDESIVICSVKMKKMKEQKQIIKFDNNKTHQTSRFKTDSEILMAKHSFKISEEKYEDKRRVITRKLV